MHSSAGIWGRFASGLVRTFSLVLVAAFLATLMVYLAPGFGVDERSLNITYSDERSHVSQSEPSTVWSTYLTVLLNASRGDFGESTMFQQPVATLVRDRAGVTGRNVGTGFLYGWAIALSLALLNGWAGSNFIRLISHGVTATLLCVPSAVMAFAAVAFGTSVPAGIAAVVFPRVFRYSSSMLVQAGAQPFAVAARARGVSGWRVLMNHAFRSVAAQHVTLAGVTLVTSFSASIPMEVLCDSPGLGQLAWRAASGRDLPVVVAITILIATVTLIVNTVASTVSSEAAKVR